MDKISIVVAVYNAEQTLKKCVDSLISQSYQNTEIILVNDSSKDSSLDICLDYSKDYSNIITINNEKNFGVSSTRNHGIKASTGDFICFVDSDDYVEPDYLEKLHSYYKKYNTVPICGFVYHDEYNHREPVNYQWSGGDELVSLGEAFRLNDELYLTALWNKLFDNNMVKEFNIWFDETVSMGEDLRFSVEYLQNTKAEFVFVFTDTLYHYTKLSNNNLMADFARNGVEGGIESLKLIRDLSKKYNPNADAILNERIEVLKKNIKYFLIRDKKYKKQEKIKKIKEIYPTFSNHDYKRERLFYLKERIKNILKI